MEKLTDSSTSIRHLYTKTRKKGVSFMKIGIIGNYGHDNNGDEAILTGILTQLTEHLSVKIEDIIIFSNNPQNTIHRYGVSAVKLLHKKGNILMSIAATVKGSFPIMKQLDVLIIGGGGLLMDMYKRDAPLYSTLGVLGHYARCKVIIYGVGAGPIRTRAGSFFIKKLLAKSDSISVRDEQSKQLLASIGVKKSIEVIGDPAFSVSSPRDRIKSNSIRTVAVTAVPYYSERYWPKADPEKYTSYITGMAQNLDRLITDKDVELTFFSTKYPQDVEVTKEIVAKMNNKKNIQILTDNLYPEKILSICTDQDLVIGTRLHSLILALTAETPVIGIGYHQKVKDFMATINKQTHFVDIAELSLHDDFFLALAEEMEKSWDDVQAEFAAISDRLKNEAKKGLKQLAKEKHP